jgi:glycosyltransferase involved in cell wall biosynthesis
MTSRRITSASLTQDPPSAGLAWAPNDRGWNPDATTSLTTNPISDPSIPRMAKVSSSRNSDEMPPTVNVSVVVPVYRSEKIVGRTVADTVAILRSTGSRFEVILINDGSPDDSWRVIASLADEYPEVTAVDLLRNYGQHSAVMCGLRLSRGEYVVSIDDDLQNPPSDIPRLVDAAVTGDNDLVVGRFAEKKHGLIRRWGSALIASINKRVFGNPTNIVMTNVRCMRRDLVDRMLTHSTSKPYITGLCLMYTATPANLDVQHLPRTEGTSNYSAAAIASLVIRILFTYSSWPLRFVSNVGIVVALLSFVFGVFVLLRALFGGVSIPGWASVVVLLSFFNGLSILILGMLGEYTVRILNEQNTREPYMVRDTVT